MRRLCLLLCLVPLAGCGGGIESQIAGKWHVDPASVQDSRLAPGAQKSQEWTGAENEIGKVEVDFEKNGEATSIGLGMASDAKWSISGSEIQVSGGNETWPTMTYDPRTRRIHVRIARDDDWVTLDLVRD